MDIWDACKGLQHIGLVSGTLYRLVESQEQIATLNYVDTLDEQAILEELLEQSKPPYPESAHGYHYLLQTPFRYPPLRWGSRFGRTHEPGILYGGLSVNTTLAESAYYRLVFWHSMATPPVKASMESTHTLLSVHYRTLQGIRLHDAPFSDYNPILSHASDYSATQELGSAMRDAEVEAFEYASARDAEKSHCVGLFTPRALAQKKPASMQPWLCETRADQVLFKAISQNTVHRFPGEQFMVDGRLPHPA